MGCCAGEAGSGSLSSGASAVASPSQEGVEILWAGPGPSPSSSAWQWGEDLGVGLGGKGLGSVLGSEQAVQPQSKPFSSLGLSFSTCEVSVPLRVNHESACAAPGSGGSGRVSCGVTP